MVAIAFQITFNSIVLTVFLANFTHIVIISLKTHIIDYVIQIQVQHIFSFAMADFMMNLWC